MMKEPEKMIIYNIFPLLAGPFPCWKEHFKRIRDLGFNWVFVNPIQEPGMSGSIYAIKDYFKINPMLSDSGHGSSPEDQVREMIEAAEDEGLSMMIDLVVNHCSVDSPLLDEHPEWFEWDEKREVVHPHAMHNKEKVVWGDLARFNYQGRKDTDGLHAYFTGVIDYLAGLGFRGFRCDAAYQVPPDSWEKVIQRAKRARPGLLFAAETLGCTPGETRKTARAGFDYVFNSSKWWDYNSRWLLNQYHLTRDAAPSIGFPENHDTPRLYEELEGNLNGVKQRYFFTALFSAGVLVPMGFEFGFRRKPHVVETRPWDWEETDIDITPYIRAVNRIKETYSVFQEEAPNQVFCDDNPMVLQMWKGSPRTGEEALLLLNKDIHNYQDLRLADIDDFFESRADIVDVSPQNPLEEIPKAFSFDLAPGEGRVLLVKGQTVSSSRERPD